MTSVENSGQTTRLAFTSLLRADFTVLLRTNRALIISIVLPLVVLVITDVDGVATSRASDELVISLAITFGLLSSGMLGYSLNVARDREIGVLQRLRITPAPTWTIMASRLLVQVVANFALSLITLIVGSVLHGLGLNAGQFLLILAVSIVGGAVFVSLGQALVGLMKSLATINAVGRLLYILLILLGTLGVFGVLGSTWKVVSEWSPVGAVVVLFTAAFDLSAWNAQDTYSAIACLGYIIVFAAVGIRWFQWESR